MSISRELAWKIVLARVSSGESTAELVHLLGVPFDVIKTALSPAYWWNRIAVDDKVVILELMRAGTPSDQIAARFRIPHFVIATKDRDRIRAQAFRESAKTQ